ncbi:cytochrome-c peroxidase [Sphingobacterium athyrii]|uniref:Cytochrome C peroxidase n=1 Tax=Sphingobacterium athyrii TaxID=2152717 RepID=A0A363P0P3_9SPHI|nr:cytochrome c peroxidase [Sphingobacterium athyrii]PUV26508.1 cytochrome C peroxidase [Sphingobacterium athyrii]
MYRKAGVIALLLAVVLTLGFGTSHSRHSNRTRPNSRERKVQKKILDQMLSFRQYVSDSLSVEARKKQVDVVRLRQVFLKARLLFKDFEWAAEYFTADLTRRLNGPPVEEIENADLLDPALARGIDPMGLQVIEEFIFPNYETVNQQKLRSEIDHLLLNTDYLISYFADHQLDDWRILDAAKLEIFRIISLGITGFDNALSLNSMAESSRSLMSLQEVLMRYGDKRKDSVLFDALKDGIAYLRLYRDFNTFDRAIFIRHFANKISTGIAQIGQRLPGDKIRYNRMLRQEVNTLFDEQAFNPNAFSPGPEFHLTNEKVILGEKLFYDVQLSGTRTRSCASCHNPDMAFTDGLVKQEDIHGSGQLLKRNTPTLLNASLQSNYFYDMRALTLEDQIKEVIVNKQEMDGALGQIRQYVSGNKHYRLLFDRAFPKNRGAINPDHIANALASYIRSLTKLNSRFDDYMRGKDDALSKQEIHGFNLFTGKAKCATCHFVPLFNGVTPPKYVQSEVEVLGVPGTLKDSILDADLGYFDIIGVDSYKYAFKIPSVRNIKKTAPYMHNGVYRNLDEVMEFYNTGGGAGLGIELANQTLSDENLHLTESEKKDIIAFMESLESR